MGSIVAQGAYGFMEIIANKGSVLRKQAHKDQVFCDLSERGIYLNGHSMGSHTKVRSILTFVLTLFAS